MENGLYIVATPIGNLQDISSRALEILREVKIVACEDTRVTKKLFALLGISSDKKFISYHDHNEDECSPYVIELLTSGEAIALVSDAGSPLISDPGYKLVKRCRDSDIKVFAVPGASAVICALQISGLPTNRFTFAGFIPNKDSAREKLFAELKNIDTTLVFYETAPRILKTLPVMQKYFNNREIAVAREITKVYEECQNGTAEELIAYYSEHQPKGECVIMVAPPNENTKKISDDELKEKIKFALLTASLKDVAKSLSVELNMNKNEIYQMGLKIKNEL